MTQRTGGLLPKGSTRAQKEALVADIKAAPVRDQQQRAWSKALTAQSSRRQAGKERT